MMALWCPDWPAVAAATEIGLGRMAPLAVMSANRVLACNAVARVEGVRRGMRRRDAQARCPQLVVVPANPERDVRLFEPMLAVVESLRPGVAPLRPGLMALPIVARGYHGTEDQAAAIFTEKLVAHGVWDVRAGIADEVHTAEQAARRATVQECVVVPPGGSAEFWSGLPVDVLADIGSGGELVGLLRRLGMTRVGEFLALPTDAVVARFGGHGRAVHQLLRGRMQPAWAPRTPPPERACDIEFEPGLTSSEAVGFSVRQTAEQFVAGLAADHLVCVELHLEVETDRETILSRGWAHTTWFDTADLVDRVRWQLESAAREQLFDGPITRVRFEPVAVEPTSAHAEALWGSSSDERVDRGVAKIQSLLGHEAVVRPVLQGGRGAADRQHLVPWGERVTPRTGQIRATDQPWPGSMPDPAPTRVFPSPVAAAVVDETGAGVALTERGFLTGDPARFRIAQDRWQHVTAWAGPWPVDERWWVEDEAAGLVARCQLVGEAGRAWVLRCAASGWVVEASYD